MGSLRVLKPGLQTLLQDRGRVGLAYYAIPRSGPLDPRSAELAGALLGNATGSPVIECHFVPPELRFESATTICLTGANMRWRIDGSRVRQNETISVAPGDVLSGSPAEGACRAYLAIQGEIQTEHAYGSAACYPLARFGGNLGAPFAAGDTLHWRDPSTPASSIRLDLEAPHLPVKIRLTPGPEYDWLTPESRGAIITDAFRITPQSNRMGARLAGPSLSIGGRVLVESVPVLPGIVQLLPSGQCVVVLADGQTTGGYPRIGYVSPDELARFNQWPLDRDLQWDVR